MSIYISEADEIYFPKTKEYFQEVLSSYAAGNYRSAVVMLYSIAICDILFKLQELRDMYNDTIASQILEEVEKCRNEHDNKSKSRWEKELVDSVYKKTELLDLEAYTNLNHLFDHRNFSAHPALNDNYELISPSRETTIAHIHNTLNNILIKPPIFIKNVIDMLTEDLKEKADNYRGEDLKLSVYLNNKYYSKMSNTMKLKVIKALWKICFCLPDDEDCMSNLNINRKALWILSNGIEKDVIEMIKAEPQHFFVAVDDNCTMNLVAFLSRVPEFYAFLDSDTRLQIDSLIDREDDAKAVAWFKSASLVDHALFLQTCDEINLDPSTVAYMSKYYQESGYLSDILSFFITYFGNSKSFNTADNRYKIAIDPFLSEMNHDQYVKLIQTVNGNDQIYNRWANYSTNSKIVRMAKDILGTDFNYDLYPRFTFDHDILSSTSRSASSSETISDDNPF